MGNHIQALLRVGQKESGPNLTDGAKAGLTIAEYFFQCFLDCFIIHMLVSSAIE